jgi:chromate transporter
MAVGFLVYATVMAFNISIKNTITWVIMGVCAVATFLLFKQPWIFPALILLGGVTTNLSRKRIPPNRTKAKKLNGGISGYLG